MKALPEILWQPDVFSEDLDSPSSEIASRYFDVRFVSDGDVALKENLSWDGVFRGSLFLSQRLGRNLAWTDALIWLPELSSFSVHENYYFLDLLEIVKRMQHDEKLFVRPCSGKKTFSGDVFNKTKLFNEVNFLNRGKNIQNCICLVSDPVFIEKEWRCVFVNNQFCSGSQYMSSGDACFLPDLPQNVIDYAKSIAEHPYFMNRFDFVIDVGSTSRGLRLIEINAFETASFYKSDLDLIYKIWSESLATHCF